MMLPLLLSFNVVLCALMYTLFSAITICTSVGPLCSLMTMKYFNLNRVMTSNPKRLNGFISGNPVIRLIELNERLSEYSE